MTWVFAVVVVAVLAVVAVVATGRGGEMRPAYDDRRDVRVQADGPLTAEDLAQVRFTTALRGYRASEVDALLDRLIIELGERSQEQTHEEQWLEQSQASGRPDASPALGRPSAGEPSPGEPSPGDPGPVRRPLT